MKYILQDLIASKKFDWVNSNITADKFPAPKKLRNDYKLFHFDRYISSKDAVEEMQKEGYEPANLYELLCWPDWNNTDWVVTLGSVTKVYSDRRVPGLRGDGSERGLHLLGLGVVWLAYCRFLAVRMEISPR